MMDPARVRDLRGAIILSMRIKAESRTNCSASSAPSTPAPPASPCQPAPAGAAHHSGARHPGLIPLVALLARAGVPVADPGRHDFKPVSPFALLDALGIQPAASITRARNPACGAPPGLPALDVARPGAQTDPRHPVRLGVRNSAHPRKAPLDPAPATFAWSR